mgnify:CR=1 FL=1
MSKIKSKIELNVELDENRVPEKLMWTAEDGGISEQEAKAMTQRLAKEEGVFAGMSSGGSVHCALKVAESLEKGVVVAIICDRGDRYLSSNLFSDIT